MHPEPGQSGELRNAMNACRFDRDSRGGHYESYFLRGNHPGQPRAFWIRYTIFSPRGARAETPGETIGELWAAFFDGGSNRVTAAKTEVPIAQCAFSDRGLDVTIGAATLGDGQLSGSAGQAGDTASRIGWDMGYCGGQAPLLLLPAGRYDTGLPRAKAVVSNPGVVFTGSITVNGEVFNVDQWRGSENHNWGSKHTDEYAWGQVAGFDNDPDAFLECLTGRLRVGPFWTPRITLVVCRAGGREYALNGLATALKASAGYGFFDWRFRSRQKNVTIEGRIRAPREHFVGLNYYNPPGGAHTCLNSKIASCQLTISELGREDITLTARHSAAFEILTDDTRHGVPIVA